MPLPALNWVAIMDTKSKIEFGAFPIAKIIVAMGMLFFLAQACQPDTELNIQSEPSPVRISINHFPEMPIGEGKELTEEAIAAGKALFFDPILSRNRDLSCSSCHLTHLAFSDGRAVAIGTEGRLHNRNSPTLFNVAWQPYLFMDGGNPTLESQVIGPIEEHREMDLPFSEAIARVAAVDYYQELFQRAFKEDVNPKTLALALATYERALVSYNSPFDRHEYAGDASALSPAQKRGLALFKSAELNCVACHVLPLTTDFSFQNNGLYEVYVDPGRARVTNNIPEHEGQFKVATLRNIALTGPYMHDGSLGSLEAVVDHYASGGSNHRLKSSLITGFSISAQEKVDLISFLEALTDTTSYKAYMP